jgi:hypothetical protein
LFVLIIEGANEILPLQLGPLFSIFFFVQSLLWDFRLWQQLSRGIATTRLALQNERMRIEEAFDQQ